MAFRTNQNLSDVLKKYQIRYEQQPFPKIDTTVAATVSLHEHISFTRQHFFYKLSESAVCESLIYPILWEVWKPYATTLALWSHPTISLNDELTGIPDFVIGKQSPLGIVVFETPFVAVIEAKRDDFTAGWAQCLLEMHTIQQLNQSMNPVFGIVSNGDGWQTGKLENSTFTEYSNLFTVTELDDLFSALTWVLESCKRIYNL